MEIIRPSASPYRAALDPAGTLPWLQLKPEEWLQNKVQYGAYTAIGARICELRLNDETPDHVGSLHVSWIKRLDSADPYRPKGVGLATHLLLMEHLAPLNKTLVSDPYLLLAPSIKLWRGLVHAGVARQTNRFTRWPNEQPAFISLPVDKIRQSMPLRIATYLGWERFLESRGRP